MFSFIAKRTVSLHNFFIKNKTVCCVSLITSTIFIYLYYYKSKKKSSTQKIRNITEVLLFTDANVGHINYHDECKCNECGVKNLKKMIEYLDSAKISLDICVFTISSSKLADVILRKHKQGVKVRIITDASMSFEGGSQIPLFMKNQIMVRTRESQFLMHHKFAIVDNELLLNGSFNWTEKATFGNWENVIITTEPQSLVHSFSKHFETLWKQLS